MNNTIHASIEGMHCGSCENKIRTALIAIPSVTDASVSSNAGTAEVHTRGDILDDESIRDAITHAESRFWLLLRQEIGHSNP